MLIFKGKFIRNLGRANQHTPDMDILEQSPFQLLFLYDDTQLGHVNHANTVAYAEKVSRGFTQEKFDFRIGQRTGRTYVSHNREGLRIKGGIYSVPSHRVPALDNYYRNGVEFLRVRTKIIVTDRDHRIMSIGSEQFLQNLPEGAIRTVPELGLRHYTSNPMAALVSASMYVTARQLWNNVKDDKSFPSPNPEFPRDELIWLPRYYRYPLERNKCLR